MKTTSIIKSVMKVWPNSWHPKPSWFLELECGHVHNMVINGSPPPKKTICSKCAERNGSGVFVKIGV